MKRIAFLLSLFLVILPVTAEIYKGLDAEGGVTYSDKETPDAKLIPTPSPNTVQMPKAAPKRPVEATTEGGVYTSFRISSPGDNATLRSDPGNLTVSFTITPDLDTTQGHTISVLLDGRPVIKSTTQLSVPLSNIDRGSHSISARVRDAEGKSLISSNSVRFHIKRLSSQHKKPAGTPPGPSQTDGSSYNPGPQGGHFVPGPTPPPPAP